MLTMIGVLSILLLAAVLAVGVYFIFRLLQMVRKFTSAVLPGMSTQAELLAQTPKSIAGMTKVYLPQIQQDFPEFNWIEFRQKADNMLADVLAAIDRQDLGLLSEASPDLQNQIRLQIEDQMRAGIRERFYSVKIHRTEIARYIKSGGLCVVKLQSSVEHFSYEERCGTGELLSGSRDRIGQVKYETELCYIQDIDKVQDRTGIALTCPQCGAPIGRLGSKFCEYCGCGVIPVNINMWSIQKIQRLT